MPLTAIPEESKYNPVNIIALANESDPEPDADDHRLDTLCEITEAFHSKLYLVRVAKNKLWEAYEILNRPFKLNRMLRTLHPVYKCIEGRDIPQALNEFIDSYHVTTHAMIQYKHSLLEKWFIKSATRSMIFDTHVSLGILPDLHTGNMNHELCQKKEMIL